VQVEHVTRIRFTTRRTTQQQRDLTVCPSLLGQVIVNDQCIFAAIAEVFAHGTTGVRCQELHRSGIGSGRSNHDGVTQRAVLFQLANHVDHGGSLLANRNVYAGNALTLLIDDRVDRNSSLTCLTVADNQFALTATYRNHRVDGLQTGLYWLINRLTLDNAWRNLFDLVGHLGVDRAFAVDRLSQRVNNASAQLRTNRHFQNTSGALYSVAFGNVLVFTENNGAYGITFQVQRQTKRIAREFQHFTLHHVGQAVYTYDTISNTDHRTFGACLSQRFEVIDAAANQITYFRRVKLHLDFLILINLLSGQGGCHFAKTRADGTIYHAVSGTNDHTT
jgi:hypothetical protein